MATLTAVVLPTSPEGALRAVVTVSADDGSTAVGVYENVVERAPDLAATLLGCTVTATAEDPSSIAGAVLHWSDGPDATGAAHELPMTESDVGYRAPLPASPALSWWVSAADAVGTPPAPPRQPPPPPTADACLRDVDVAAGVLHAAAGLVEYVVADG